MAESVFVAVVLTRFLLPLFIPRYPLPAILACLVVDAVDQTIFAVLTDDPLPGYQTYDKALDVYYQAIAYITTMRAWRDGVAFRISRFLYLYRLVGVTLFELTDERWLLLVFPNTFEYFFIAYEAIRTRWDPNRLRARTLVAIAAFIWIVIKLPQEWWIHVAQLDFTDFVGDHPWVLAVIGAAALVLAAAIWHWRASIPEPDWPFTVDGDRHLPPLEPVLDGQEPFFSAILAEKVVLLALLSVIFSQILPDLRATALGLAAGVAVLVVANAAISQWLQRRGRSWSTTASQFGAMLAINLVLVTLDSVLGPDDDGEAPALATLFMVVLLSLIIAMFDRYRSTRRGIDPGPTVLAAVRAERAARDLAQGGPAVASPAA